MRVEELILEGFKSYPVRTTITGWDASFNAITGLNGSGKSNILDAICFVLGITNMSQMRAQNQQDLIYKRGQAGITKASVTIVFDNSEREKSPVGFENYKQVTVTRQIALPNISKYLLNGHKSQQQTIQTLFQSVQLNINNPNFLIMQGKITKVLNMRPQEILGMVEEAAGTRMFEERKDKAKKTMGKKEKKVEELTAVLNEEITPKLNKLREEKRAFLRFQKIGSDLERLARTLRAFDWYDANRKAEDKEAEVEEKQQEGKQLEKDKKRLALEIQNSERDIEQITAERDRELKKGGKYKQLEEQVAEMEKTLVKVRTQVEIKQGTVKSEEAKLAKLEDERKEAQASLEDKRAEVEQLTKTLKEVKDKHTETETAMTKSEELLQSLLTGLAGQKSGGHGGYMGQLAEAQQRQAQAKTEEDQAKMKLTLAKKEAAALEQRYRAVEREAGESKRALDKMRAEVEALRKQLDKTGWSEEKEKEATDGVRAAQQALRQAEQERENVRQRMSNLNFEYQLPNPNFDRSKVKGLVATLISLDPQNRDKSTALEITAGGKLYNVVVQDERVGKDLLQNGRLKKRVTIIPLNKINSFRASAQKIAQAKSIAPGKVHLALDLVGYPDEVAAAMAFVFGDAFVCDDPETAKKVTFSANVRTVTIQGDVYDPSGTLTGGAAPSGSGVLLRVQELLAVERTVGEARGRIDELMRMEERQRGPRDAWRRLAKDLELKEHEMKNLEGQVENSNAARTEAELKKAKDFIGELEAQIVSAQAKQKAAHDECKKLEKDMAEFKDNKEGKIDELKATISKQKAALQKQSVVLKTHQKEVQTATLEFEGLESDIAGHAEALAEAQEAIQVLQEELKKLTKNVKKHEADHAVYHAELEEERAKLSHYDEELKSLASTVKDKKEEITQADLAIDKLKHDVQALEKEKPGLSNYIANLEKQFPWIEEEKGSFGEEGTAFDFENMDIAEQRQRAANLEAEQKGMKKKINPRVASTLDGIEKKEQLAKKNLQTVLKDKEKIEATIEELDRYKRDALQKTWEKVNGDFGGIFAELLPGNFAKLQPPEGQDLTEGLEVKVRLGSVWKQSLTELSGGQRSLIALSLIMSLLQFKPAPMYILDEIDAALDLSHTQHIGQLFRTRFKGSQFIVVSLKEGLFTNANVLFRTRFRDGTSIVERTATRSGSNLYNQ